LAGACLQTGRSPRSWLVCKTRRNRSSFHTHFALLRSHGWRRILDFRRQGAGTPRPPAQIAAGRGTEKLEVTVADRQRRGVVRPVRPCRDSGASSFSGAAPEVLGRRPPVPRAGGPKRLITEFAVSVVGGLNRGDADDRYLGTRNGLPARCAGGRAVQTTEIRRCRRRGVTWGDERRRPTQARKPDGYLLGTYRIATAPEPNSSRSTSFKSTRFESPANNVGP
jgi:hypothetical protein